MNAKRFLQMILRIGFALLLGYASIDKIRHPYDFAQAVTNYRVIGESLSYLVAITLPYVELFTALCLMTGFWLSTAIWLNLALMWMFFIMVLQAFFRGLDIHCGCFTVEGESSIGPIKIGENLLFALLSVLLLYLETKPLSSKEQK